MTNKERMEALIKEMEMLQYDELVAVFRYILKVCPEFTEKELSAHDFKDEILSIIANLSCSRTERHIQHNSPNVAAHRYYQVTVASQAASIRKTIYVYNGEVGIGMKADIEDLKQ